ncbi:sodium/hydrogen exchanger [Gloeothece citriformis PCC 7424]|uniref:Sodium/hydrogen exchanger n=1 Tax=Gloeothece citriformis (strain PCC 7424) TaxID=65393 RepID=B7KA71_GLOC7|nr:cation:proton antiporter [Gloeothece citriformis]ACK72845.1 sodium/hydrogen exchanger [Gloeothece citriformis PCC 7424]
MISLNNNLMASLLFPRPIDDPVAVFLTILAIMLIAPLLFERLRLPGIVGLILAGVVVGPNGLGLLERDDTIILLGTVGLLFLMFMAGLETSLDDLKTNANKAIVFGLGTFALPMIIGTVAMLALGYGVLAAVLVASCFASHTLLALPVLGRLGIMRSPAVTATLGATLITNVLALLVLAVVVKAHGGTLTLSFWLFLIPALAIYTFASLWGVPQLGRWFFRRFGHDEGAEFIFVLAALFVVSYLAGLIEIEPIIGAFLAGIALTPIIPQLSPLMNRIQFIGNTLFVPFFLISVGMLIDPLILIKQPKSLLVASVMIVAEVISKYIAAWIAGKWFKLSNSSIMVMFGLSMAQAASTLAAITVAYQIKLVDQLTVNGIIAMILVTCIASPWITERWGRGIKTQEKITTTETPTQPLAHRVLVPVANPSTEDNLLNLALILTKASGGTLLPLHVLRDQGKPISSLERMQQRQLLESATRLAHATVTSVEPIGRIDDTIDGGIVRTALEHHASLIICGWKGYSTYQENFFGSVLDRVARRSQVPMLITRFTEPIRNLNRVLLAVTEEQVSSVRFQPTFKIAKLLSTELKATLQILVIFSGKVHELEQLKAIEEQEKISIKQKRGNFVSTVFSALQTHDLLILEVNTQSTPRVRTSAVGKDPEDIARSYPDLSMLIFHFPDSVD